MSSLMSYFLIYVITVYLIRRNFDQTFIEDEASNSSVVSSQQSDPDSNPGP